MTRCRCHLCCLLLAARQSPTGYASPRGQRGSGNLHGLDTSCIWLLLPPVFILVKHTCLLSYDCNHFAFRVLYNHHTLFPNLFSPQTETLVTSRQMYGFVLVGFMDCLRVFRNHVDWPNGLPSTCAPLQPEGPAVLKAGESPLHLCLDCHTIHPTHCSYTATEVRLLSIRVRSSPLP